VHGESYGVWKSWVMMRGRSELGEGGELLLSAQAKLALRNVKTNSV
jgi:hypothetical protein